MKKALFCSLISLSAFAADGPDVGELNVQKSGDSTAELITITLDGEPLSFDPGVLNRCETFRNMCIDCRYEDYTKMVQEAAQNHIFKELTHAQAKRFIDLLNMENGHQIRKYLAQYISDHKEQARKDLLALYKQADYMNVSSVYKACKRVIGKTDIKVDHLPPQLYVPILRRILRSRINKALLDACGFQSIVLKDHTGRVNSAVFSPDGKQIVSASDDETVCIWNADTGECLQALDYTEWVQLTAGERMVSASDDGTVCICDAETGRGLQTLEGHTGSVQSVAFSPDGKRIVSASADKTVRIWNADTGRCLHTLKGHTDWVCSAAFSSDGKRIVSASWDKTVRIWNAETGNGLYVLKGHAGRVWSAEFSPDGKRVVSVSDDGTVRIWNADTGRCLHTLKSHNDDDTYDACSAAFSPDGKQIVSASGDNTVRIWDAQTGGCLHILKGHNDEVYSAAFSPDGKQIVSVSCDHTVRIWQDYERRLKLCPDELIELLDKARISWQDKKPYQVTADEKGMIDEHTQSVLSRCNQDLIKIAQAKLLKDERLFCTE